MNKLEKNPENEQSYTLIPRGTVNMIEFVCVYKLQCCLNVQKNPKTNNFQVSFNADQCPEGKTQKSKYITELKHINVEH